MAAPNPATSIPSRQRKLGPAPFASFEDLSDDNDPSPPSELCRLEPMPEITEDTVGGEEEPGTLSFGPVTLIPHSTPHPSVTPPTTHSSVPNSGPASALQTPSTPRIDISCASSSTPPSEESNSERELFVGGLGLAFQEDGADDLRSSTEELEFGHDDDIHDERTLKERQRERDTEELLRRASHPANIFTRNPSLTPNDPHFDLLNRKPSAHSLYLDGYLSRPTRHSSFGASDRPRPGALSSLSDGRRSASPHKMLLETSFCGNKPIPTPSLDLESPPQPPNPQPSHLLSSAPSHHPGTLSSDSSFESHNPTLTTVQVHHQSSTPDNPPLPTTLLSNNHSPESPKSSDHWKPISPKPSPTPKPSRKDAKRSQPQSPPTPDPSLPHTTPTTQSLPPTPLPDLRSTLQPIPPHSSSRKKNKEPPKVAQRKPLTKQKDVVEEPLNKPPPTLSTFTQLPPKDDKKTPKEERKSPREERKSPREERKSPKEGKKAPKDDKKPPKDEKKPPPKDEKKAPKDEKKKEEAKEERKGAGQVGEEMTTELKISEEAMVSVEDVPTAETKGFFLDDSLEEAEEEDLPYVPTTLPQEKPAAVRILGVKERSSIQTTPTQRPRSRRPPNPASLNDYIQHSIQKAGGGPEREETAPSTVPSTTKMKINLPRDDSLPDSSAPLRPKSPKKKFSTTWTDFAEMGLRSPREIRRRMREELDSDAAEDAAPNNDPDDTDIHSYQSDSSLETAGPVNGGVGGGGGGGGRTERREELTDEETETLLKLPRVPFANDLDVSSTRSSLVSQEDGAGSPVSFSSAQMDLGEDN